MVGRPGQSGLERKRAETVPPVSKPIAASTRGTRSSACRRSRCSRLPFASLRWASPDGGRSRPRRRPAVRRTIDRQEAGRRCTRSRRPDDLPDFRQCVRDAPPCHVPTARRGGDTAFVKPRRNRRCRAPDLSLRESVIEMSRRIPPRRPSRPARFFLIEPADALAADCPAL
jgi:hypothetical protein